MSGAPEMRCDVFGRGGVVFLSLVLGALAGWATIRIEPALSQMIAAALKTDLTLPAPDFRVLTLLVLLILAALVLVATGSNASLGAAMIGTAGGYFGPGLYKFLRYPNDVAEDARWDGRMREPGSRPVRGAHSPDASDGDTATLDAVSAALSGDDPAKAKPADAPTLPHEARPDPPKEPRP